MNSNVVYASVCRNGGDATAYGPSQPQQPLYNGGATTASATGDSITAYYHHPQAQERLIQPAGSSYLPTTLMTHYSSTTELRTPPLHPEATNGHPRPHQIISDSNGLSYTNLDQSHFHQQQHHNRVVHASNPAPAYPHHHSYSDVGPRNPAYHHPYRNLDYSYDIGSHQAPDHTQGVPLGPEGARVVPGFGVPPSTYSYLDSLGLSRRNGYTAYENYDPALRKSCQMNGGYQFGSHVHRTRVPTAQPTPVPTYKWMQVKRSAPKPQLQKKSTASCHTNEMFTRSGKKCSKGSAGLRNEKKRSGRRWKITERDRRSILRTASITGASSSPISNSLKLNMSSRTLRRILQQNLIMEWKKMKTKPKLEPRHMDARLQFAQQRMPWTTSGIL